MAPWGRGQESASGQFNTTRFAKTGAQIQGSLEKKIEATLAQIQDDKVRVSVICDKRGLTLDEVMQGADDQEALAAYTSKAYTGSSKLAHAVNELEEDLNKLKSLAWGVRGQEQKISDYQRVKANIEAARVFDLTYAELVEFGF